MTPEELKTKLTRLGMTPKDLSLISGLTERQVRDWRSGETKIPQLVDLVLTAMDTGEISLEFVVNFTENKCRDKL